MSCHFVLNEIKPSNTVITNWHSLNRLKKDLHQLKGFQFMMADTFERFHKLFESEYENCPASEGIRLYSILSRFRT